MTGEDLYPRLTGAPRSAWDTLDPATRDKFEFAAGAYDLGAQMVARTHGVRGHQTDDGEPLFGDNEGLFWHAFHLGAEDADQAYWGPHVQPCAGMVRTTHTTTELRWFE